MNKRDKPEIVKQFLRGRSVSETAEFFGMSTATTERILREAITQLAELNRAMGERINHQTEPAITIQHQTEH